MDIITTLARELGRDKQHVENVVRLLDEGNTIPFIARYRKELHGSMDDTALRQLETRLQYLRGLDERRQAIEKAIDGQGKLTPELKSKSGAPEPLLPRKRDWSPWQSCSLRSRSPARSPRRQRRRI